MVNFKKTFLIDLTILLIVVGALAGGLLFFGRSISGSVDRIAGLRQDIVNRSASLDFYATLRNQYNNEGKAYLNVLHNIVPTKDQLIDLPKEFQSLASQQNIGFGFSFAGETAVASGGLGSVTFRLNLEGQTLDHLLQFVRKLQDFRYLSSLDSLVVVGRVFYH